MEMPQKSGKWFRCSNRNSTGICNCSNASGARSVDISGMIDVCKIVPVCQQPAEAKTQGEIVCDQKDLFPIDYSKVGMIT